MKQPTDFAKPASTGRVLAITLACFLATAGMQAHAQAVKAPPLPPGSSLVRVMGGMDPDEIKREARAHHHKGHVQKDVNKDDSLPGNNGNGNGNGNTNPGKKS